MLWTKSICQMWFCVKAFSSHGSDSRHILALSKVLIVKQEACSHWLSRSGCWDVLFTWLCGLNNCEGHSSRFSVLSMTYVLLLWQLSIFVLAVGCYMLNCQHSLLESMHIAVFPVSDCKTFQKLQFCYPCYYFCKKPFALYWVNAYWMKYLLPWVHTNISGKHLLHNIVYLHAT